MTPYPTITNGTLRVRLLSLQSQAYDEMIAAARTCYSARGLVDPEEAAAWDTEKRNGLSSSIFAAGHHTTLQHSHATFAIEGVTRQTIWSFLHSHPFYNSEQISQRYVAVSHDALTVPESLDAKQRELFSQTAEAQMNAYRQLCEALTPSVRDLYLSLFPARGEDKQTPKAIERRAQEVARYVLPLATHACLHHTVSTLTILRYHRMMTQPDAPTEQRALAEAMAQLLIQAEPEFAQLLQEPIPQDSFAVTDLLAKHGGVVDRQRAQKFVREFDTTLEGKTSKLVDYGVKNEALLASAVREVLGISSDEMSDDDAITAAMNPSCNKALSETMNIGTMDKLTRTLWHPHYSFRKRISHCADSQDQRHRMTPASRPILMAHFTGEPDVITPSLIDQCAQAKQFFDDANAHCWKTANALLESGADAEAVSMILPNAVAIRFTQSADLLSLRHKMAMRLCFNAQEEICMASHEEAQQIAEVNPRIGQYLDPPCITRHKAGIAPKCPEGSRYCGHKPWLNND